MTVRTRLSDAQWRRVAASIGEVRSGRDRPPLNDRNFIEAALGIHRTGTPWRDLPSEFGPWKTVYNRFDGWAKRGWWRALFERLRSDIDDEWFSIDSTIHRAHQHSAGATGGLRFMR